MIEKVARAIFRAEFAADDDAAVAEKWEEWQIERRAAKRKARAAIEAMRELITLADDCASELEAELQARYPVAMRKAMQRQYDRDMETVLRVRMITAAAQGQ